MQIIKKIEYVTETLGFEIWPNTENNYFLDRAKNINRIPS